MTCVLGVGGRFMGRSVHCAPDLLCTVQRLVVIKHRVVPALP